MKAWINNKSIVGGETAKEAVIVLNRALKARGLSADIEENDMEQIELIGNGDWVEINDYAFDM